MEQTAGERQFDILRLYGELAGDREDWSGALVLACGSCAEIVPATVSIANGTSLWLTDNSTEARSAMRRGEVDFVVNTLDEALRTLKNQIRQKRPLGVALLGDVSAALAEIVDRGVLPETMLGDGAVMDAADVRASVASLEAWGMSYRVGPSRGKDPERWEPSMMILDRQRYYAYHVRAQSLEELRAIDAQLLGALPEQDIVRRRWLQRVSRYLRDTPEGGRWLWLREEELAVLPDSLAVSPESR
jgi:Urocanase Rossmann-like domain